MLRMSTYQSISLSKRLDSTSSNHLSRSITSNNMADDNESDTWKRSREWWRFPEIDAQIIHDHDQMHCYGCGSTDYDDLWMLVGRGEHEDYHWMYRCTKCKDAQMAFEPPEGDNEAWDYQVLADQWKTNDMKARNNDRWQAFYSNKQRMSKRQKT